MSRKLRSITVFIFALVVAIFALSACDFQQHDHEPSTAWGGNSIQHWHACSCGMRFDTAPHTPSDWVVDTPATLTSAGSQHKECTVCKHILETAQIPQLTEGHEHAPAAEWSVSETAHWHACSCGQHFDEALHTPSDWVVDTPATVTATGSKHKECTVCGKTLETATIDKLASDKPRTVDFYAINDFHGKVDRMSTVAGYLAQCRNANPNTVLINSGDMFQGSMESNSNFGNLLSDCMDDVGFDAFVFGNHEFDWGLGNLQNLASQSNVPFLGANIYHWDADHKVWGTFASELAQEYVVKTLDNGLKIGIIGVIGKDQITSISSQLVQTVGFKDPKDVVPTLYAKLKTQLMCDVVVISAHTGPETFTEDSRWDITEYCDALFCAHTHRPEIYYKNGVPIIQGGSYGSYVSHVALEVSPSGAVTCKVRENISYNSNWPNKFSVAELIDNSNEAIREEANQVLSTAVGPLSSSGAMPRIVCNAIADYAAENYPEYPIALAMINVARNDVNSGPITYTELYNAIPFDNTVYIALVSGMDIMTEANYGNYIWRVSEEQIENSNTKFYYIAVIDYLLFHQNSNRDYNYFRSFTYSGFTPVALNNQNYDDGMYNYRLITRDWMLARQEAGNTLSAADYSGSNARTDTSLLTQKVTFTATAPEQMHAGTLSDPYTVGNAAVLASGISGVNDATAGYLKATVSSVNNVKYSSQDGAVRNVYVCDEYGRTVQLYWISKYQGATAADNWDQSNFELHVGDEVVLYGYFIMYNDIVEITKGYCVSINGEDTN